MSQIIVSGLRLAPASADLPAQDRKLLLGRFAPGITNRKTIPPLFQLSHFCTDTVNLAAQAGLPTIKRSCIQEKRMADLMAIQIDHAGGDEHADSPIEAKHGLDLLKGGELFDRNLDYEIEHRVARTIRRERFPQAGSQGFSGPGTFDHQIRQSHLDRFFAPMACPCS